MSEADAVVWGGGDGTLGAGAVDVGEANGRAMVGRLRQDRDFEALAVPQVEVATPRRVVRVALDGERLRMESPVRFRIRPRALRVLAPEAPGA